MEKFDQLQQELNNPGRKIVITCHQNPDGDALGASLALWHYFKHKGHKPVVITPTDYPEFLSWLPGNDSVLIYPYKKKASGKFINDADLIFMVDFNSPERLYQMRQAVLDASAVKVVIDHHLDPVEFFDYGWIDPSAGSTCELIYRFIERAGDKSTINYDIALCLYIGIMTDTGSFRFSSTTANIHRIAAELIEHGVQPDVVYNRIENSFTENRLRFFGFCLTQRLKVIPELHTAYIWATREDLEKYQIRSGDTEGLVNYPLKMKNIIFSAFITDRIENIRLSFRSKGDFDVSELAKKYFNGGGHKNASGGTTYVSLEQTLQLFEEVVHKYSGELKEKYAQL